jgi:formate C-acetyltransferase
VAIDTSALQFESDETMRRAWGDDGAIACCVSPMMVGKQMQFFGARANLAKCLLYAINGGRDEISGKQIAPALPPVSGEVLDFDDVIARFEKVMDWLAGVYVNAMNVIHYMHDKYAYERVEMALHDYAPLRTMAFGIAGMSVVADSLSAIKYAKVRVVRDATGLVTDYQIEGEFPKFGNNDTSFTARPPAIRRTAAGRASHSRPAQTRCTGATAAAFTRPRHRWPRSRIGMPRTASR